jgi:hypothetical protein
LVSLNSFPIGFLSHGQNQFIIPSHTVFSHDHSSLSTTSKKMNVLATTFASLFVLTAPAWACFSAPMSLNDQLSINDARKRIERQFLAEGPSGLSATLAYAYRTPEEVDALEDFELDDVRNMSGEEVYEIFEGAFMAVARGLTNLNNIPEYIDYSREIYASKRFQAFLDVNFLDGFMQKKQSWDDSMSTIREALTNLRKEKITGDVLRSKVNLILNTTISYKTASSMLLSYEAELPGIIHTYIIREDWDNFTAKCPKNAAKIGNSSGSILSRLTMHYFELVEDAGIVCKLAGPSYSAWEIIQDSKAREKVKNKLCKPQPTVTSNVPSPVSTVPGPTSVATSGTFSTGRSATLPSKIAAWPPTNPTATNVASPASAASPGPTTLRSAQSPHPKTTTPLPSRSPASGSTQVQPSIPPPTPGPPHVPAAPVFSQVPPPPGFRSMHVPATPRLSQVPPQVPTDSGSSQTTAASSTSQPTQQTSLSLQTASRTHAGVNPNTLKF